MPNMKLFAKIIILSAVIGAFPSAAQNYDSQAKKIEKQIKQAQQQQKKQEKSRQKVSKELKKTSKKLNKVKNTLKNLNSSISQQESLLKKLQSSQKQKQGLEQESIDALKLIMQQHAKQQTPNMLQHLLSIQDSNELERQQTYLNYFAKARTQQIEELRVELQTAETSQQEYIERQAELKKQKQKQQKLAKSVSSQNKKKQSLLKKLDKDIASKGQTIKKLKTDQKRLSALIKRLEKKKKQQKAYQQSANKGSFASQKGKMTYPIVGKITRSYGQRTREGLTFNGLAIKATKRGKNPVKAVYSGKVIFSSWLKGFGNLIIVDHGGGYMSLYGNNGTLNKKEGTLVNARETIASYNEKGQAERFYFELRRKGKTINPKGWLR